MQYIFVSVYKYFRGFSISKYILPQYTIIDVLVISLYAKD